MVRILVSFFSSIDSNFLIFGTISNQYTAPFNKDVLKNRLISQYAMNILNRIAKPFNENYIGWTDMMQGFQTSFVRNPRLKGMES